MKDIHIRAAKGLAKKLKKHPDTPMHKFLFDLGLLLVGIFILFVAVSLIWVSSLKLPSFNDFEARKVANSTRIYDRTGTILLYNFHANIRRTVVPFDQISPNIKEAVISIEDDQFYHHIGIRPTSILRSVLKTATGDTQGGSTITQQVVKNALLSPEKTITRKLKEWILALKLEHNMTKDEILGVYLNESPFGGTIYGVEEASLQFFGKHAKDVDIAEAAYLAALPQAPSRYSPYGSHLDELENRKNLVLSKMLAQGYITKDEYSAAKSEKITFQTQAKSSGKALHFDFYIREYLEDKYGTDMVENGGLKVISTLDWELQQRAESTVHEYALKNSASVGADNAGLVALDSRTGQILAMVGSRDYFDDSVDGKVNITLAKRQPGSSFKPIVYAAAFEKGYTPETTLFDVPTEFNVNCPVAVSSSSPDVCYHPVNYDGKFRGPVSLRSALAQSLNVPAVKLLYLTGVNTSIEQARKMGITTLGTKSQYGLTLVLGGGEVTLLELTSAYTTFANEGEHPSTSAVLSITDNTGKILEQNTPQKTRALSSESSRMITSILTDNAARTPAYGPNSPLYFGERPVAVKTGTTNDVRDVWTVGYTPSITVGVWGGNNDNRPVGKQTAGAIISPMWRNFMDKYFELHPEFESFNPVPDNSSNSNPILRGVWCSAGNPIHSILYYLDKENPREYSPGRTGDGQFRMWEGALQIHGSEYSCPFGDELGGNLGQVDLGLGGNASSTPSENPINNSETKEISLPLSITGIPTSPISSTDTINISTYSNINLTKVEYSIGGSVVGSPSNPPFNVVFSPNSSNLSSGTHTLMIKAFSQDGYSIKTLPITIK